METARDKVFDVSTLERTDPQLGGGFFSVLSLKLNTCVTSSWRPRPDSSFLALCDKMTSPVPSMRASVLKKEAGRREPMISRRVFFETTIVTEDVIPPGRTASNFVSLSPAL